MCCRLGKIISTTGDSPTRFLFFIIWNYLGHCMANGLKYFPSLLKGQCHKIFWNFFISWIEAIWASDKKAKMVLLKSSFSRRYSRKIWLRAVLACAESDSAQAYSVQSFAGNNFVCAGLSLLWKRILNLKIYIYELLQHSPTFFVSFLKG